MDENKRREELTVKYLCNFDYKHDYSECPYCELNSIKFCVYHSSNGNCYNNKVIKLTKQIICEQERKEAVREFALKVQGGHTGLVEDILKSDINKLLTELKIENI